MRCAPLAQLVDLEHDVDRDAVRLEMVVDAGGAAPAGVEQGAQVLRVLEKERPVFRPARLAVLAQLLGDARQLVERRVDQQLRAHPLAQLGREAGGAHRAGEEGDGFEERAAPVVRQAGIAGFEDARQPRPASRRRSRSARRCPGRAERAGRTARRGRSSPASAAAAGRAAGCRTRPRGPCAGRSRNRRAAPRCRPRAGTGAASPRRAGGARRCARARRGGSAGAAPASALRASGFIAARAARGAATRPGGSPTDGARRCRPSDRPR